MQSESINNVPTPITIDCSTYYAYTEFYFDEPVVMYVAVGTDESGKILTNGVEIRQDRAMSWYKIDKHVQPSLFKQGVRGLPLRTVLTKLPARFFPSACSNLSDFDVTSTFTVFKMRAPVLPSRTLETTKSHVCSETLTVVINR